MCNGYDSIGHNRHIFLARKNALIFINLCTRTHLLHHVQVYMYKNYTFSDNVEEFKKQ